MTTKTPDGKLCYSSVLSELVSWDLERTHGYLNRALRAVRESADRWPLLDIEEREAECGRMANDVIVEIGRALKALGLEAKP